MRVECFGASRPQQGRTANEDAFLIRHGERPFALLCDGAGNAQQAAKKVLSLFDKLFKEAAPEQVIEERSEEHTSELQSRPHLVCRLLLEKKKTSIMKEYSPDGS